MGEARRRRPKGMRAMRQLVRWSAGPDGRHISVLARMSLLFGALSLPARPQCSPKRAPARFDVPPLLWTVCLRQLRTAGGSHLIVDWTEIVKAGVTPDGVVKGPNVVLDFPHCVRLALPFVAVNELNF